MDEPTLRGLIDQVKHGHLSRRLFLQAMAAVGIGAPLAAQMLASGAITARGVLPPERAIPTARFFDELARRGMRVTRRLRRK